MITEINVDGFKTLSQFQLTLNSGLNVLVGPNGSGKTNIVSFFEFLSHLVESDAAEATSRMGGAGAVFRKVNDTYQANLTATVLGCFRLTDDDDDHIRYGIRRREKAKRPYAVYEYGFTLLFSGDLESVVLTKQHFKYKPVAKFTSAAKGKDGDDWAVEIEVSLDKGLTTKATIRKFDESLGELLIYPFERKDSKKWIKEAEQFISSVLQPHTSIPTVLTRYNPALMPLSDDITGGQTYNIIPSRVKLPEDSAKSPGIASDGSGLSATLYALKRRTTQSETPFWFFAPPRRQGTFKSASMDSLKGYFQLANEAIADIDVANDPFNNQLRVSFQITSGDYTASVPLTFMSDGTLKWLALVTAALTAPSVFSIEEPENYLHPQMQAQFVAIMREILFREKVGACTLMTTHSETVLNHCKPAELIVVNLLEGRTVANRCDNQREVSQEIEKTGFGLGYYYIAGALQDE